MIWCASELQRTSAAYIGHRKEGRPREGTDWVVLSLPFYFEELIVAPPPFPPAPPPNICIMQMGLGTELSLTPE